MKLLSRESYYPLLTLITLGLILWQYLGMNHYLSYSINKYSNIEIVNRHLANKESKALMIKQEEKVSLFCRTVEEQKAAFCGLNLLLGAKANSLINLQHYDTVILNLSYHSNVHDTVFVQLLNQPSNTTTPSQLHQQVISPVDGRASYRLSLAQFYPPSWWIFENADKHKTNPSLKQASHLRVSTGDNSANKNIELSLHSLSFSGKWLPASYLYFGLLTLWALSLSLDLITASNRAKKQSKESSNHTLQLNRVNSFLSIERDNYEFMAKTDPLTSCLNRAGLRGIFSEIIIEYIDIGMPASIVLFDIDHFKLVNDQFGHDEGDKVLVNIASLVKQQIREDDYLARWGGEEFLVVCPHTRVAGARSLAEHLRSSIESTMLSDQRKITSSFGVAEINSGFLEQWIKRTDEALYKAKENGRNRVESA
ncbi:GGDEF domain-containing protein [Agarivorans sp. MS3-6]